MIGILALALAAASPQPAAMRPADPPIKLWLSADGEYASGDHARVHLRAQQDGYVVVLRADGEGRLRVLFPVDPGSDNFVRGGDKREIRSRGDRDAFIVDERGGDGLVVAAWSPSPFHFNDYVRSDHWDYAALDTVQLGGDKEAGLLSVVQDMAGTSHFDYDALPYSVTSVSAYYQTPYVAPCWGCGWGSALGFGWGWPGLRFGFGWGTPLGWGAPYCAPYWGCRAFYSPAFYGFWNPFSFGYGRPYYGYRFGFGRPYAFGTWGLRPYGVGSGFLINRVRSPLAFSPARVPVSSGNRVLASRARPAMISGSRGWTRSAGVSYMSPRSARTSAGPRSGGFGTRAARSSGSRSGAHRR
ncbi:MAG TPA: DUF4384 domain-containing protein [Gemmatimonadales bacterium]|nr:DUF4384 domain-containing protein [Gemmatimonadales bacterium]